MIDNQPGLIQLKTTTKDFFPVLRGFRTLLKEDHIVTYTWVETGWADYDRIYLKQNQDIYLEIGDPICRECKVNRSDLDKGYCSDCLTLDSEFQTRLHCMFDREDSVLNSVEECSKKNIGCDSKKNAKYCHSSHVLYIGRFGNKVKVGVSRTNRRGTYTSRLVEQGLNEAFIVKGISGLPKALELERLLVSLGYSDYLTFSAKIEELHEETVIPLEKRYKYLLEQLEYGKEIEYLSLYDDYTAKQGLEKGPDDCIQGKIVRIQGPILITEYDSEYFYWNTRDMLHRELLNAGKNWEENS